MATLFLKVAAVEREKRTELREASEILASTYFSGVLITVHILLCNFSPSRRRLFQLNS